MSRHGQNFEEVAIDRRLKRNADGGLVGPRSRGSSDAARGGAGDDQITRRDRCIGLHFQFSSAADQGYGHGSAHRRHGGFFRQGSDNHV